MSDYLFAYGTLCDAVMQQQLLGRILPAERDLLDDYTRLEAAPYPIAMPCAGGVLEGLCLTVQPDDLSVLDAYEGALYVRIQVMLRSRRLAWVYIGNETLLDRLRLL